jgi:putative RNA 2'-phosphotransferase
MRRELVKKSKFLSLILRHNPQKVGLKLDSEGWASIPELLKATGITREELDEIVATNDKKRFAISDDGERIRASQGHSIDVDLRLKPRVPPDNLFHGTATRFLGSIKEKGLLPMNRQYVHLSKDVDTARKVGLRHGKPLILRVDSARMKKDGHQFFLSDNGVWLTKEVPWKYLTIEGVA